MQSNTQKIHQLARNAGNAIMEIYQHTFEVHNKADNSPVTAADMAAHHILVNGLSALTPSYPVLSEESGDDIKEQRLNWSTYWLIDPLDGTKEFIKRNGEFTVNIALIENGVPIMGIVYAPALDTLYWGELGRGAFKQIGQSAIEPIHVTHIPTTDKGWRVVGSRSHQTPEFSDFMQKLPEADIVAMGSSLKLCLIAEGKADLYPRLGPTSEWDTAAAHAIVIAAGGQVVEWPTLTPLTYNQRPETLLNPYFIACPGLSDYWSN